MPCKSKITQVYRGTDFLIGQLTNNFTSINTIHCFNYRNSVELWLSLFFEVYLQLFEKNNYYLLFFIYCTFVKVRVIEFCFYTEKKSIMKFSTKVLKTIFFWKNCVMPSVGFELSHTSNFKYQPTS